MFYKLQVPNGMGCRHEPCIDRLDVTSNIGSPSKLMYFADSLAQTVYAFDFDASAGNISSQRAFYTFSGSALPDGLTVDETGGVGGRGIILDFITTARMDLEAVLDGDDGDEIKGEEGAVCRLHVDVKGLKKNKSVLSRK
jgi:hypothetical protein